MHEMSLAMNILELAEEEAAKNGCNRLSRICVDCGALCGAMPEALEFYSAFNNSWSVWFGLRRRRLAKVCFQYKCWRPHCQYSGATARGPEGKIYWEKFVKVLAIRAGLVYDIAVAGRGARRQNGIGLVE